MSKSILVTGGAGFIGSHLCEALLARGDCVVVLDNFCSGKRENLHIPAGALRLVEGDVRQLSQFTHQIGPVDTIVHLAALISGYNSLSDPDDYEDVNIRGLLRVIEYAAAHGVKRILFASSSTVYGNQPGVALSETTAPDPLTVYALTKLAGEHLVRLYSRLAGFSHCTLRLFNVYGPRQATNHPYANVTCKFSYAAANSLPVKLFGDGEQSRDFIYVGDVVRAFLAVLDESREPLYNIGTGHQHSINQLLGRLEEIVGAPVAVQPQPEWPNDIRSIRADTSRFEREFDIRPQVSLSEGLAKTVGFFRTTAGS